MSKSKILVVQLFSVIMADFYTEEKKSPLPEGFKIPNKKDFKLLLEVNTVGDGEYLVTDMIGKEDYSEEMVRFIDIINNTCVCLAVVKDNVVARYKRVNIDEEVKVLGFKVIEKLTDGEEQ